MNEETEKTAAGEQPVLEQRSASLSLDVVLEALNRLWPDAAPWQEHEGIKVKALPELLAALAATSQSPEYSDATYIQAHTAIEQLTWHLVPGPKLPDADTTVLCQLEADDEDCWPGYYDGERWISAEGFPFTSRVIAWSQPRGVKP